MRVADFRAPLLALLCLCALHTAAGYLHYARRIPNGDRVPSPCEPGAEWPGVGHENPMGAGVRNQFGKDFAAAGHRWTEQLCRRDSDGDGRTNGEELGDPGCVWSEGAAPSRTTGITHPGVCPLDSATCTNGWDVCPEKFDCPAFREQGVYMRNLTLKETRVPPRETTYICQAFELNVTATPAHMIGTMPILKNKNVVHHMILYACPQRPPQRLFDNPQSCFMGNHGCVEFLSIWAYGIEGECFNKKAGVLIGGNGYQYGLLEIHWNNPEKLDTYVDSSGLSLYYTDRLREFNQGCLNYGELTLVLPPKQPIVNVNHSCPAACSSAYQQETRYITSAMIHMHEYGVRGRTTLWRDGVLVKEVVPMHDYDYDSPRLLNFDPPIELRQGDEVKTECYFSTVNSRKTVFWGFETSDEMCFSIMNYYPNDVTLASWQKLSTCYSHGGINECMLRLPAPHVEQQCNVTALRNGDAATDALRQMTSNRCHLLGCNLQCRDFLNSTFWPQQSCFDPRRAKRMAETVSTMPFLIEGDSAQKQRIARDTLLALHHQLDCEQELSILAAADSRDATTAASTPAPTQPPTNSPTSPTPGRRGRHLLSQRQLFVIVLVVCCLAFATAMLALLVLGVRLLTHSRRSIGVLGSSSREMSAPAASGKCRNETGTAL